MVEPSTYPKCLKRIFETAKCEAKKTLKNRFVLVSSTFQIHKGFCAANILPLFRIVAPDSVDADELAIVYYMECTNAPDFLDETLACLCLYCSTVD